MPTDRSEPTAHVPAEATDDMLWAGYQADDGICDSRETLDALFPGWREDQRKIYRAIERRAQERGYHLSAEEQLANLAAALAADNSPCPHCGARDD